MGALTATQASEGRSSVAPKCARGCAAALALISLQVAFPQAAVSQDADPQASRERSAVDPTVAFAEQAARTEALLREIRAEEARAGIHSRDLIELMTTLGLAHQEHGDHALAAEAFERARQIVRVNYGFSTVEEMHLLRRLVASAYARGDVVGAWSLEQQLLTHATPHARSLDAVPVFRDVARRRGELYARYSAGEIPPQMYLGCYYAGAVQVEAVTLSTSLIPEYPRSETGCRSGSRRTALVTLLNEYRSFQAKAISALLANDRVNSELLTLTADFLRSSHELYLLVPKFRDVLTHRLVRRMLAAEPQDRQAALLRAELLVRFADYNLFRVHQSGRMTHLQPVLDQYAQAFQQMAQAGADEATLKRHFFPDTPVRLPTYERAGSSPGAATQGPNVELSFELTRYGLSRRVRVENATPGVSRSARRAVAREIRQAGFRPRLPDGRHPESARVVARFAVDE